MKKDPCTMIAEIGCNHCGSFVLACDMITIAADVGCTDVKLQIRDVKNPPEEWNRPYSSPHSYGTTYRQHRQALELATKDYRAIVEKSHELGMLCGASVWDIPSVYTALDIDIDWIKIPSAHVTDLDLIGEVQRANRPVVLSTGMSDEKEIHTAVEMLRDTSLTILHCTSCYPCKNRDVNLLAMLTLMKKYPYAKIGISGHWSGVQIDAAAVALGAQAIERHFTLDRSYKGTDHKASLAPEGLARWVRDVRIVERAMGSPRLHVLPCEEDTRAKLRPKKKWKISDEKKTRAKKFFELAISHKWLRSTACICGHTGDETLAHTDRFGLPLTTVVCLRCGTVRRSMALTKDGQEAYYSKHYRHIHTSAGTIQNRILWDTKKGQYISDNILNDNNYKKLSVIGEVGAGTGHTINEISWRHYSKRCHSVDLDPGTMLVQRGDDDLLPYDMDFLLSVHVLEHQSDPINSLKKWANHLKNNGILLTIVPDFSTAHYHKCVQSSGDIRRWFHLAHTWEWTAQTAMLVHILSGLQLIKIHRAPPGTLATVGSLCILSLNQPGAKRSQNYMANHMILQEEKNESP